MFINKSLSRSYFGLGRTNNAPLGLASHLSPAGVRSVSTFSQSSPVATGEKTGGAGAGAGAEAGAGPDAGSNKNANNQQHQQHSQFQQHQQHAQQILQDRQHERQQRLQQQHDRLQEYQQRMDQQYQKNQQEYQRVAQQSQAQSQAQKQAQAQAQKQAQNQQTNRYSKEQYLRNLKMQLHHAHSHQGQQCHGHAHGYGYDHGPFDYQFNLVGNVLSAENQSPTGLFGVDELSSPEGWETLYNRCLGKLEASVARLLERPVTHHDDMVQLIEKLYILDSISVDLCSLMDPAELCRSVMPNSPHAVAADKHYNLMAHYVHMLNANPAIYNCLKSIYQHREFTRLPAAHREFVIGMMSESEINGIHLSETQRRAAIDLKCQIAATGGAFIQELNSPAATKTTAASKAFLVGRQSLTKLPREYSQYVQRVRGDEVIIDGNPTLADGILKYVDDPLLRKSVYLNSRHGVSQELLFHLEKMVGTRDQLAKVLGYNTYSEYTLSSKLIETPDKAMAFLGQLSNETRELSDAELNMLYTYKCKSELTGDPIFQWDYEYYSNLIREKTTQQLNAPSSSELSEYFSLENVLEGMSRIVHQLFGLKLKQIEMRPGESWDGDVIKFALISRHEGIIGYIYMDLWQRMGKASLGVNYVMELGYRKSNFNLVTGETPMMEDYNVPKVALVCSFGSKNQSNQFRSLLEHSDLEVMFHEFGHSLHTVLSRGDFQHLCGTRGPVDFVEIPSTLMEHFTWDHKILRQFATHYASGRTLSSEMINSYKQTKDVFKGIETQKLISLSMFDLILHGKHPNMKTPSEIMSILQQKNLKIAGDVGDSFLSGFSHLYFYGSSYYSYLLSKYYSDKIWKNFFGNGYKVNREKGEQYRRKFLQKGSSQTPQSILNHFTA